MAYDTVFSHLAPPYGEGGVFNWQIPWIFRSEPDQWKSLTTMPHIAQVDSTGKMTVTKGEGSASCEYGAPNSP